ncbi:MAG: heavy-metal-associated domain-containing protein [Fimbriimonadaceae bacterium]|jgi:copper chaperone|nr:heavy-metal-associated domain-containing protein [Fimbriimonadaceae bacterium]
MQTTLKIEGMSCQNCVRHAREALLAVEGVTEAEVTLTPGQAIVTHEDAIESEALMQAIEAEGYQPSLA